MSTKSQQFSLLQIDRVFNFYTPKPPLSKFVDCFWLFEGRNAAQQTESILPTGTLELAINLRQNELAFYDSESAEKCDHFSGAVVSGAHGHGFTPAATQEISIIGVHFKPGGAFPFLGLPADELADTHVDLETLWGPFAHQLQERLSQLTSSVERFQLLEQGLLSRLREGVEKHYAVAAALEMFGRNQGGPIVREAAQYLGLSQRRFIQVFKTEVGLTPKLFSRIQRFQQTRAYIQQHFSLDWAAVAVDLGYFDQSHLIREFVEFSGLRPTAYLTRHQSLLQDDVRL